MSVGHQEQPGDGEEEVEVVYQQQQQEDGNGGSGSGRGPQQAMWVDAIGEDAGCSSPAFQTELAEPALPLPPRSSPQSLALRLARHSAPLALHMHRLSPSASMPQSPSRRGAAGGAAGEAASSAGDGGGGGSMQTPFGAGNLQRHSTGASFPGGQPSHSPSWDWGARQASGFLDPAAAASPVVADADAEDSQRSITRLMGACCAPCCRCQRCCRRGLLHLPGSRLHCSAWLARQASCAYVVAQSPAAFLRPTGSVLNMHPACHCCCPRAGAMYQQQLRRQLERASSRPSPGARRSMGGARSRSSAASTSADLSRHSVQPEGWSGMPRASSLTLLAEEGNGRAGATAAGSSSVQAAGGWDSPSAGVETCPASMGAGWLRKLQLQLAPGEGGGGSSGALASGSCGAAASSGAAAARADHRTPDAGAAVAPASVSSRPAGSENAGGAGDSSSRPTLKHVRGLFEAAAAAPDAERR